MSKSNDEVQLARNCKQWPVDVAEKLLANPLPWGPPTYVLGKYIDDPNQPHQSDDFLELAHCVDGAYNRHGGDMGTAWNWANPIINSVQEGGSCTEYMTQDLLDIVFLCSRGERFSDGLIRSMEPILREMMREVVRRVHSSPSPVFLTQK
ncbi:MAG: hypothetical protein NVSMB38_44200 [Ktedonobacteraceae bacterium]